MTKPACKQNGICIFESSLHIFKVSTTMVQSSFRKKKGFAVADYNQQQYNQQPQPQPQPQYYQQPQPYYQQPVEVPVSTGDWMLTMFLTAIPLVGFVLLLVWAFGSTTPLSKKNWARAGLIWCVIAMVLSILLTVALGMLGYSTYETV